MNKEPSFSIVDEDDDNDDFEFDNMQDEDQASPPSKLIPNVNGDEHGSSEENTSPQKKPLQIPSSSSSDLSSGRKTVTKMRPPPQLIHISSESESEDTDEDKVTKGPYAGEYDPKQYEDLEVSGEIQELFQYITKYVPQQLALDFKFKPFIPDYIPAVGDIDAFLKVIPPEVNPSGEPSDVNHASLGLSVLDEPAANQSDPAVLHLQLRAASVNVSHTNNVVVKKVTDVEKNSKVIDKWIKDISDLHRSKSSPVLKYSDPMPDLDELLEEWPETMENLLKIHGFPSYTIRGPLTRYIDIVCALFDIPIYGGNRIQSLHLLFSLYAAVKTSHLFRSVSGGGGSSSGVSRSRQGNTNNDQVLLLD